MSLLQRSVKNCPLCKAEAIPPKILPNQQRFFQCQNCRLLFDGTPESTDYKDHFYNSNSFLDLKLYLEKGASVHFFAHLLLLTERAWRLVNSHDSLDKETLKLLEIGCGPGLLLDMARYFGWRVQGIEPSSEASDFGSKVLDLPILQETFTANSGIRGTDVIVASEVIEHLKSPKMFLTDTFNALSRGGIVLITTPNAESKTLEDKGESWVHLGKGYHLILYTAAALEKLLKDTGFQSVALWTFEGEYKDERIIALAAKRNIPQSIMETIRRPFDADLEANVRCIRYLRYILDRFDKDKNVFWQGAFYRLIETLNKAQRYSESISTANRLEKFLQKQGFSEQYLVAALDAAGSSSDRSLVYSRMPTFIGNFYLTRGLALLRTDRLNEALDDFYRAHTLTDKLEALPGKSYEESASIPPSLYSLFHIGYSLLLLGSDSEAISIFEKVLCRQNNLTREALAHVLLNCGVALKRQGRLDEAINRFKEVTLLGEKHKMPLEIVHQATLELSESQLSISEEEKRALEAKLKAEKEAEIEALKAEQTRLSQEVIDLQATLKTRDDALKSQLSIAEEEKRALEAQLKSEKAIEIGSLKDRQARLSQEVIDLQATLKTRDDALKSQLSIAEEERRTLETKLKTEKAIEIGSLKGKQAQLAHEVMDLQATLKTRDDAIKAAEKSTKEIQATLDRIYDSHGWKVLLAYYRVRNLIFPPGSKRKVLAQRIFHALLALNKNELENKDSNRDPLNMRPKDPVPLPKGPIDIAACTIISKNYIAFARTLARSFHRFHPDTPFFVLLVDRADGYFHPEQEQFHMVAIDQLDIPDLDSFCFKYTILELNTAAKPYFLSHLFDKYRVQKLLYFDPDILILERLHPLFQLLDSHSVVLTPHLDAPFEDHYRPNELDILLAGTYNLGFIGLASTPNVLAFLRWWEKRVYDNCLMAPREGMHVDQRWIDLVPSLFDGVYILRDAGYNVAYWNLHSRSLELRDGRIMVNGSRCYFFHFSGLDPSEISKVSKHQNRFAVNDIGAAGIYLFERYRDLLLENGYHEARLWPYAFGSFDNGSKVPDAARLLYYKLEAKAKKFGNPFSTCSDDSFFNWLNTPVHNNRDSGPVITRLWFEIYESRTDVKRLYPEILARDREAFFAWTLNSGRIEHQIDERLIPQCTQTVTPCPKQPRTVPFGLSLYVNYLRPLEAGLKPILKQILSRNRWIWNNLMLARNRMIYGRELPLFSGARSAREVTHDDKTFGVNLAGYLESETGVGEAGRGAARALKAASVPYALNNVVDSGSINPASDSYIFTDNNPYGINLVHVNADQVPIFAAQKGSQYFSGRYNIGCWFWELSEFPEEWHRSFQPFDEIWAASSFIQDALSKVSPVPVVRMPVALSPARPRAEGLTRSALGLHADSFVFLFIFDYSSILERKNPLGLVDAFKMAFTEQDNVTLALKVVHSELHASAAETLKLACCNSSNIRIIDRVLSRREINTLLAMCDCYVSLHRSEGLGIPIAEAMILEKPVVVTAYSGNMDFTTPSNSFLVKYRLVELERDHGPYRKGSVWADPDLNHAAELMRHVYENRNLCAQTGQRAREEILQLVHPGVVGKQMKNRLLRVASVADERGNATRRVNNTVVTKPADDARALWIASRAGWTQSG